MTTSLNRRALVAGASLAAISVPIAASPPAALANVAGISALTLAEIDDIALFRLYGEYIDRALASAAAWEKVRPAHAAYDAELPPCPDGVSPGHHRRAHDWLWRKHGLDELYDAANTTSDKLRETIAAIMRTEAVGLFGVGVKLTAIRLWSEPEVEDYEEVATLALRDIDRLIGTKFALNLEDPEYSLKDGPDSEDDEDEVQTTS